MKQKFLKIISLTVVFLIFYTNSSLAVPINSFNDNFNSTAGSDLEGIQDREYIDFSENVNEVILREGKKWYLDFNEEFNGTELDKTKFSDLYLTHWTDELKAKANYNLDGQNIHIKIDKNQEGWRTNTKQQISSIQTGMRDGLHIFDSSLSINGHHRAVDNYGTKYGYFELRAKAQAGSGIHSAWWMVGDQATYDKASEIDIFEILGKDIYKNKSKVWVTIHPWMDSKISRESLNYKVNTDISEDFHTYGFEWTEDGMKWYFDGELIRSTKQSPDYKMYTLLGIYQSYGGALSWVGKVDENQLYPKEFVVDYFRVYKTEEMRKNDEADKLKANEAAEETISRKAIFGGDFTWDWYHQVGHLNDADMLSTLQSKDNIELPATIYVDFEEETSIEEMDIYTHYAQGQGITDFVLEYSKNGEDNWIEFLRIENYKWNTNSSEIEKLHKKFTLIDNVKAVRLRVLKANMEWKHFAINEIEFR